MHVPKIAIDPRKIKSNPPRTHTQHTATGSACRCSPARSKMHAAAAAAAPPLPSAPAASSASATHHPRMPARGRQRRRRRRRPPPQSRSCCDRVNALCCCLHSLVPRTVRAQLWGECARCWRAAVVDTCGMTDRLSGFTHAHPACVSKTRSRRRLGLIRRQWQRRGATAASAARRAAAAILWTGAVGFRVG